MKKGFKEDIKSRFYETMAKNNLHIYWMPKQDDLRDVCNRVKFFRGINKSLKLDKSVSNDDVQI